MLRISYGVVIAVAATGPIHAKSAKIVTTPFPRLTATLQGLSSHGERHAWLTNRAKLAEVFAAERLELPANLETKVLKFIGNDVNRHFMIASFLLDGDNRDIVLGLLLLHKVDVLLAVQPKKDWRIETGLTSLFIKAAIAAEKAGINGIARYNKKRAETLMSSNKLNAAAFPALSDADLHLYRAIPDLD